MVSKARLDLPEPDSPVNHTMQGRWPFCAARACLSMSSASNVASSLISVGLRDQNGRFLPGLIVGDRWFVVGEEGRRGEPRQVDRLDSALRRPERDVVLDPVAGEDLDLAVVHLDRTRHRDLPLRVRQDFPDARLEVENARRPVEFLEHRVEDRSVCGGHDVPVETGQRTVARLD